MKPNILISVSLFILVFLFWQQKTNNSTAVTATEKPITRAKLVEESLQKRIQTFKQQKLKQCRQEAYQQANKIVDSTLIAQARADRASQINRPPVPSKPERPEILKSKDTTAVKPLIVN